MTVKVKEVLIMVKCSQCGRVLGYYKGEEFFIYENKVLCSQCNMNEDKCLKCIYWNRKHGEERGCWATKGKAEYGIRGCDFRRIENE